MKGKVKCFGLFLVCSITLGLSLSACSNTNALMYPISTIDFSNDTLEFNLMHDSYTDTDVHVQYYKNHQFNITLPESTIPDGFEFPRTWNINPDPDTSWNNCRVSFSNPGNPGVSQFTMNGVTSYSIAGNYNYYLNGLWAFSPRWPWSWSNFQLTSADISKSRSVCQMYNMEYYPTTESNPSIYGNVPKFDWSGLSNIGLVDGRANYEKSIPYFYNFNGLMLDGTMTNEEGHVVGKNMLNSEDIFKKQVKVFNNLTLNLSSIFSEPGTSINDQSEFAYDVYSFTINGTMNFWGEYDIGDYAGIQMDVLNYNQDSIDTSTYADNQTVIWFGKTVYPISGVSTTHDCTFIEYHSNEISYDGNRIDFSCTYNASSAGAYTNKIDFNYLSIGIRFSGDPNNSTPWHQFHFVESNLGFSLTNFNVVTNGDPTPAGWSATTQTTVTGGDWSGAPGNNGWDEIFDPAVPGFDLSNLFNFNVLNPFVGIFGLFTHSNSCVNISTLAGMLGSTETSYCPWFDSTTRAVLTPVFGIAGTMLVFGFVIRWLSSSSGNFFEDSSKESITKDGGRWTRASKKGK